MANRVRAALFIALSLAYPLVVYLALGRFESLQDARRWLAIGAERLVV